MLLRATPAIVVFFVLIVSVCAYRPEVYKDENGVSHLKEIPKNILHSRKARQLKDEWSDLKRRALSDRIEKGGHDEYDHLFDGYEEDAEYYMDMGKGKGGEGYIDDDEYYAKGAKGGKSKGGDYYDDEYYEECNEYYNEGKGTKGGKSKGYSEEDEDYYDNCEEYYYDEDYYGKGTKGAKGGKSKGGGGKGEPSMPPKPVPPIHTEPPIPVPPMADCFTVDVLVKVDEMTMGEVTTAVGDTFYFPFTDAATMEVAGVFLDASTTIGDDGDCVFNGSFSTDYNDETQTFDSQITISGTCFGMYNSITGGTGQFACANGVEIFTEPPSPDYLSATLYICNAPCGVELGYR